MGCCVWSFTATVVMIWPFIMRSVILVVKAIKTVNNFDTKKSARILVLSGAVAVYLCAILYGLLYSSPCPVNNGSVLLPQKQMISCGRVIYG